MLMPTDKEEGKAWRDFMTNGQLIYSGEPGQGCEIPMCRKSLLMGGFCRITIFFAKNYLCCVRCKLPHKRPIMSLYYNCLLQRELQQAKLCKK